MFYADEIRKLSPLVWLFLIGIGFWAAMFYAWPVWTAYTFAALSGILLSYAVGYRIRAGIRILLAERRAQELGRQDDVRDELAARRKIQE